MHGFLVLIGVLFVAMLLIHILFRVIKFTLSVFVFGILLILTLYVFQNYFGIDLIAVISSYFQ